MLTAPGREGPRATQGTLASLHFQPLAESALPAGDRVAVFEELYRRCYHPLVDLCRHVLAGRGDAEAVAQESLLRAWTTVERLSGPEPFWPWVATVARRLCIDHHRRHLRESAVLDVQASMAELLPAAPEDVLETGEDHRSVRRALAALSPAERRVMILRDIGGCPYEEIGRIESLSTEAVRGLLKRARASFRTSYRRL